MVARRNQHGSDWFDAADLLRRVRRPRRGVRSLIVLATVLLVGNAVIGERGWFALRKAHRESADVSAVINALRIENQDLRERARELLEEPGVIEALARDQFGFIEDGELLIIVADPADDHSAAAPEGTNEVDDD